MNKLSAGQRFMLETRYAYLKQSGQACGDSRPTLQLPYDGQAATIELPEPDLLPDQHINFLELIEMRTSVRKYGSQALSLSELSYLLWCTQGVKSVLSDSATFRNVPSAGARHAFETYLLINRVDGVAPGLYRFLAVEHKLVYIRPENEPGRELTEACLNQQMVAASAVTFLWAAVVDRMTWRYGERGYRYLHLDAGHVCQNLYLAGQSLGCGVCAIAAFDDEKVNASLGIDGVAQFAIYAAAVGK